MPGCRASGVSIPALMSSLYTKRTNVHTMGCPYDIVVYTVGGSAGSSQVLVRGHHRW